LLEGLPAHNPVRSSREDELAGHRAWLAERLAKLEPQMGFLRAMRAALPEDGILVDEVTQLGFAVRMAFPIDRSPLLLFRLSGQPRLRLRHCFGRQGRLP
jgi:acetolactate synthase I/II/III large subunit